MKTLIFIAVVSGFLFTACQKQKPIDQNYYSYCGMWGSSNHSLQIWEDGHAMYGRRANGSEYTYSEKIYIDGSRMTLRGDKRKQFTIDEVPHLDSITGNTEMKLSGELYYKN